ncbi:hypothetical protein BJX66DRAFT_61486 [Aspergillus keveii]|uniref:Uncharacterized protein n=1 Tax=Aspergillus keveii TaxID=714993 RepID=A0ABR4FPT9_9EURO
MQMHNALLPLRRLLSIDVVHDEDWSVYEDEDQFSALSFFMHPPSLRHVRGVFTDNVVDRVEHLPFPSPIPSLDCHDLFEDRLEPLLGRLPNLHTLSLQPGFGSTQMILCRSTLYAALIRVKSTLRRLTITTTMTPRITVEDNYIWFAPFDKLETLNIPWRLLIPLDPEDTKSELPPNVQNLTINNTFTGDAVGESEFAGYHLVEEILTEWRSKTPRLESVLIEDVGSWHMREKEDLQKEADESGLKVTWAFLDLNGNIERLSYPS